MTRKKRIPIGWAELILYLNGPDYTQRLLDWWKTKGIEIHGMNTAMVSIDSLTRVLKPKA